MPRLAFIPLRVGAPPLADGWRAHAACTRHRTLPPETWDDILDRPESPPERAGRIRNAKAVCRTCPVRDDCLADIDLLFDEGVRGGVEVRELKAAARRAQRSATR